MVVGLPLYFLKIKPMQEEYNRKKNEMLERKRDEDISQIQRMQSEARIDARRNYREDMSTSEKGMRFSNEEKAKQIA